MLSARTLAPRVVADVYGGYKAYAFPHDELRPISRTHTDSLVELGAASPTRAGYSGVALTLIDSLDTLAILGNASEFSWAVRWVGENVSFDLDVEVRQAAPRSAAQRNSALSHTPRARRPGVSLRDQHPGPWRPAVGPPACERPAAWRGLCAPRNTQLLHPGRSGLQIPPVCAELRLALSGSSQADSC